MSIKGDLGTCVALYNEVSIHLRNLRQAGKKKIKRKLEIQKVAKAKTLHKIILRLAEMPIERILPLQTISKT